MQKNRNYQRVCFHVLVFLTNHLCPPLLNSHLCAPIYLLTKYPFNHDHLVTCVYPNIVFAYVLTTYMPTT